MAEVRVLIVDDQEPFRRAMGAVVEETDGFVVVGSATSGEESLTAAAELRPDLVLMDVNLPGHRRDRGHAAADVRPGRPGRGAALDVRRGPVRPRRLRRRGVRREGRLRARPALSGLGRRLRLARTPAGPRRTGTVTRSRRGSAASEPPAAATRSSIACRSRRRRRHRARAGRSRSPSRDSSTDACRGSAPGGLDAAEVDGGLDPGREAPPGRGGVDRQPAAPTRSGPGASAARARARPWPAGSGRRRGSARAGTRAQCSCW